MQLGSCESDTVLHSRNIPLVMEPEY